MHSIQSESSSNRAPVLALIAQQTARGFWVIGLAVAMAALNWPWFNIARVGVSGLVWGYIVSLLCAAAFIACTPPARLSRDTVWGGAMIVCALLVHRAAFYSHTGYWAPTIATILAIALMLLCARAVKGVYALPWIREADTRAWMLCLLLAVLLTALVNSWIALAQFFQVAEGVSSWIHPGSDRAFGNVRQPNIFATLTAFGLAALYGLVALLSSETQSPSTRAAVYGQRMFAFGVSLAVLSLAAGNAVSDSRTGSLEWLMIAAMSVWWAMRSHGWGASTTKRPSWMPAMVVLVSCVLYFALVLLIPHTQEFLPQAQTQNAQGLSRWAQPGGWQTRMRIWSDAWAVIQSHPWRGYGWGGGVGLALADLPHTKPPLEFVDHAHNLPLHMLMELGAPLGGAILVGFGFWVWRRSPWHNASAWVHFAWMGLAVLTLHSLLEYPLWSGHVMIYLGVLIGLLDGQHPSSRGTLLQQQNPQPNPQQTPEAVTRGLIHSARQRARDIALGLACGLSALALAQFLFDDWWRANLVYFVGQGERTPETTSPVDYSGESIFFRNYSDFAAMSRVAIDEKNAAAEEMRARRLLRFSAEGRTMQRGWDAALQSGDSDAARYYENLIRRNYPALLYERQSGMTAIPPAALKYYQQHGFQQK